MNGLDWALSYIRAMRNYKMLDGRPERKRQLERYNPTWDDNTDRLFLIS
jgi:hypothetical protein